MFSQKKHAKEIGFISDNDLYVSAYKDKYYTNGFFLSYRYLTPTKNKKIEKKIIEWQLGHLMYTPFKATIENIAFHDRPFAAYLYLNHKIKRVYKNKTILTTSVQLGTLGKAAFGKELQDFIHDIYNFKRAVGWKYQIKDALGINLSATYLKKMGVDASKHYDISWINNVRAGTIFTDISSGFYTRIGFKELQSIANSIAFKSHLNDATTNYFSKKESFLFIKTMLSYNLYDATLQGSFLNTGSVVTKSLIPINFYLEVGIKFSTHQFNYGYTVFYNTDKSKGLYKQNDNIYGSINLSYTF